MPRLVRLVILAVAAFTPLVGGCSLTNVSNSKGDVNVKAAPGFINNGNTSFDLKADIKAPLQ